MTLQLTLRWGVVCSLMWLLLPLSSGAQETDPPCRAANAAVRLDHAIVAVADLDAAAVDYRASGFTLKPGRLHANGLINQHIEFISGSELELMSVRGEPGDATAQSYAELIAQGDGGAYVALNASVDEVHRAAERLGIESEIQRGRVFDYLVFAEKGPLGAVFIVEYHSEPSASDSLSFHQNGAVGLDEAWVEGDKDLIELLLALGGRRCGVREIRDGRLGEVISTASGRLVVVPPDPGKVRRRLLGVVVGTRASDITDRLIEPTEAHGIWIWLVDRDGFGDEQEGAKDVELD